MDERIRELLPDYARGHLAAEQAARVERALAKSQPLREELRELRDYYAAIDTMEPVRASDNFLDGVNEKIESRRNPLAALLFGHGRRFPFEAAGLVVAAVLLLVIIRPFDRFDFARKSVEKSEMAVESTSDRQLSESEPSERVAGSPAPEDTDVSSAPPRSTAASPKSNSSKLAAPPPVDMHAFRVGKPVEKSKESTARRSTRAPSSESRQAASLAKGARSKEDAQRQSAPQSPSADRGRTSSLATGAALAREETEKSASMQRGSTDAAAFASAESPPQEIEQHLPVARLILAQASADRIATRRKRSRIRPHALQEQKSESFADARVEPEPNPLTSLETLFRNAGASIFPLETSPDASRVVRSYRVAITAADFSSLRRDLEALGSLVVAGEMQEASKGDSLVFRLDVTEGDR